MPACVTSLSYIQGIFWNVLDHALRNAERWIPGRAQICGFSHERKRPLKDI